MNIEKVVKRIERGIRLKVKNTKKDGIILGLSGGLDSAVVCKLCANAIDNHKVWVILMPRVKDQDYKDAIKLTQYLDVPSAIKPIGGICTDLLSALDKDFNHREEKIAIANLKPRLRMIILYFFANINNLLVAGTSNKSEILIGYFTKFGDGASDFLPIGDLYKTEVIEVAKYLKIPENIINKKPSAGLWEGQTDEEEIGIDYETLDKILNEIYKPLFDRGYEKAIKRVAEKLNVDIKTVWKVANLIDSSYHKRKPPKTIPLRRGVESKIIGE